MDSWKIDYEQKEDYLQFTCTGEVEGLENMIKYCGAPIQIALEHNAKKVLIDESKIRFKLTDSDSLALMSFFLNNVPKSIDITYSVVYDDNNLRAVKLFEELSQNVGFPCYFSKSLEEAVEKLN